VLSFDADLVLDGRTLERPANYLLVRVKPPEDFETDPKKRPFVVVDPRAGHGPGIGGFKADSELGVAMRAGHPAYFVGFTPEPVPGQTLEDVMRAEAVFLEKVLELHPEAEGKPCVIGNCQAGWAVMMLAAVRPELFGPIIVPGAPLSYWAGVKGENPMRYTGGLLGGSWLTALAGDFGSGKFDGANLVSNFENLNPANTYWSKNYNVYSKVDSEAERFLEFEKWWGGHVTLNAEEMQWIVDELFIGNRLATAEITTGDGVRVDLRNINSPIVCFCSEGDNITPPQQALGWIVDLYEDDNDILANEQTIVYSVHPSVGHLGIFVSGGVARKEHQEFASNIDLIDVLRPGLYEVVLQPKTEDSVNADLAQGDWIIRFEPRTLNDVRAIVGRNRENEMHFATVRRVSDINLGLYRTLFRPFVSSFVNDQAAEWWHTMQPAELPYELFSDKNPMMKTIASLAEQVRENRRQAAPDNVFLQMQEQFSKNIIQALDGFRDFRDQSLEQIFHAIYGQPFLQAVVGLRASDKSPRQRPGVEPEHLRFIEERIEALRTRIGEGGVREATVRALLYLWADRGVDERAFNMIRAIRAEVGEQALPLEQFKMQVREQFFALLLDQEAALAAIPHMLARETELKTVAWDNIQRIAAVVGPLAGERKNRFEQIRRLFGMEAEVSGAESNGQA